jgi:hypothetical protein
MMHGVAVVMRGLCCVYVAKAFRKAGLYGLATLFALACAGVITGLLTHWPLVPRAIVWSGLVGCAAIGAMKLRNHA